MTEYNPYDELRLHSANHAISKIQSNQYIEGELITLLLFCHK